MRQTSITVKQTDNVWNNRSWCRHS